MKAIIALAVLGVEGLTVTNWRASDALTRVNQLRDALGSKGFMTALQNSECNQVAESFIQAEEEAVVEETVAEDADKLAADELVPHVAAEAAKKNSLCRAHICALLTDTPEMNTSKWARFQNKLHIKNLFSCGTEQRRLPFFSGKTMNAGRQAVIDQAPILPSKTVTPSTSKTVNPSTPSKTPTGSEHAQQTAGGSKKTEEEEGSSGCGGEDTPAEQASN